MAPAQFNGEAKSLDGKTIYVVDNPKDCRVLTKALQGAGATVVFPTGMQFDLGLRTGQVELLQQDILARVPLPDAVVEYLPGLKRDHKLPGHALPERLPLNEEPALKLARHLHKFNIPVSIVDGTNLDRLDPRDLLRMRDCNVQYYYVGEIESVLHMDLLIRHLHSQCMTNGRGAGK